MCCKKVGESVQIARKLIVGEFSDNKYVQEIAAFPHPFNIDGSCTMLNDDHTCKVYNDRPDICNIEKTFNKYKSSRMTLEQYYEDTIKVCNQLIIEGGADKKYLING